MFKTLRMLSVLALAILPIGHASAATITETLTVGYTSASSFSFTSLNFSPVGSPATNFLGAVSLGPYASGSQNIFSANVNLDPSQTYNFSFSTSSGFSGNANLTPSSVTSTFATITAQNGGGFFTASASISPVAATTPLPAALPLFGMALLGLGGMCYRAARKGGSAIASVANRAVRRETAPALA